MSTTTTRPAPDTVACTEYELRTACLDFSIAKVRADLLALRAEAEALTPAARMTVMDRLAGITRPRAARAPLTAPQTREDYR